MDIYIGRYGIFIFYFYFLNLLKFGIRNKIKAMELGNIQKYKNTFVFEGKKIEKAPSISYVTLGQTNIILIKASDEPPVCQSIVTARNIQTDFVGFCLCSTHGKVHSTLTLCKKKQLQSVILKSSVVLFVYSCSFLSLFQRVLPLMKFKVQILVCFWFPVYV